MEAVELNRRMGDFYLVASEVLRDVSDITEQQIKHWIVNPFLVALGWDPHDKHQVFLDYPIKPDGGHADYALLNGDGKPKLVIEVRAPGKSVNESEGAAKKAKAIGASLILVTNGSEFSLWYVNESEPPTPLFILPLKELSENAESLFGLSADFRLSETGIGHLRKSAIRLAVIQMLEENSERTFEAIVDWVQSQVSPGSLDETTEEAIREATTLWLTEEHFALPAFAPAAEAKHPRELRATSARDWEPFPGGAAGTFRYRFDTAKSLDVRQPPKEVRDTLRGQGLKTPTSTAFGGFYYALRQKAGLPSTN